jgi:hypothetical protein
LEAEFFWEGGEGHVVWGGVGCEVGVNVRVVEVDGWTTAGWRAGIGQCWG